MKRKSFKKIGVFLVALAMVFILSAGFLPFSLGGMVSAEAGEETVYTAVTEEQSIVLEDTSEYPTNDEMLYGFLQTKAYGDVSVYSPIGNTDLLDENEKKLYDAAVAGARKVANGEQASTAFTVDCVYTYADTDVYDQETFDAFCKSVTNDINFTILNKILLTDYPYIFYWYDKTGGMGASLSYIPYIPSELEFTIKITLNFTPASVYKGTEEYTVDTNKTLAAKAAGENAAEIAKTIAVEQAENTYGMLHAFKEKICEMVSYDEAAADAENGFQTDINPWQLINVFDDNTETNVVCEGYSKAFMYLCQLAGFDECYLVSGVTNGNHMWNHVVVDGKSYLVDVTNCDEGTIGSPDNLFMKGMTKVAENSYKRTIDENNSITYTYDVDTVIPENVRALSNTCYTCVDADSNGACDSCKEIIEGKAVLYARSITLGGELGVNFYMGLSAILAADTDAYMLFAVDGKETKVMVKDIIPEQVASLENKICHKFTCNIYATQMADVITAKLFNGTDVEPIGTYTYSVQEYGTNAAVNNTYSETAKKLAKAMLVYGGTAQTLFSHNTGNLASSDSPAAIETDLSGYHRVIEGTVGGITYCGTSTLLDSNTAIRHYFTLDNNEIGTYTFTVGNTSLTAYSKDGMYYVDITDIAANNYDVMYELKIAKEGTEEVQTIKYSVYSYIISVNNSTTHTEQTKALVKAAYHYSQAVEAYVAEQSK